MDANRPRSTLEVPRRHKGTNLEAPKPGPIHNHAPALSDADFDMSKYAQNEYARAEYIPQAEASPDYKRAPYAPPATPTAPAATAPMTVAEARRADPNSWRNDTSSSRTASGLTPTDPLRDDLTSLRFRRQGKGSALDPISDRKDRSNRRPQNLDSLSGSPSRSTTPTSPSSNLGSGNGPPQSWQQAFEELTSDPSTATPVRIAALLFGFLVLAGIGTAILGSFFWMGMFAMSLMTFNNLDGDSALSGMVSKLKSFFGIFHPALATTTGLRILVIGIGLLSFLMFVRGT